MGANTCFGILLLLLVVQLTMAEEKSYSKASAVVLNLEENTSLLETASNYQTILKVSLFPYIPDLDGDNHQNLLRYIQDEFQKLYPDVYLYLHPLNTSDRFYDAKEVSKWLAADGTGFDVVEVDMVILGDLVEAGVVAPQHLSPQSLPSHWHPAAASAVRMNGEVYAYPHLICAIVLITRDSKIAAAVTIDDLVRAAHDGIGALPYNVIGNLNSSWDITALYLDSYLENTFPYTEIEGLFGTYSYESLQSLRKLASICNVSPGDNKCLNGFFDDNYDLPAQLLGYSQAKALYGYPERLHHVLKIARTTGLVNIYDFKIKPLPLGEIASEPLFFTDAFVFRRNMPLNTLIAAHNFAEFMATPKMQAAVAGAEDTAKTRFPLRYLLPMSANAYNVPPLNTDYFYQTFFRNLTGRSLPNYRVDRLREVFKEIMYNNLNRPF